MKICLILPIRFEQFFLLTYEGETNPFVTKKARKITAMQYIRKQIHSNMSEPDNEYAKTSQGRATKYLHCKRGLQPCGDDGILAQ